MDSFEDFGIFYSFPFNNWDFISTFTPNKIKKRWQKEYLGARSMSKC